MTTDSDCVIVESFDRTRATQLCLPRYGNGNPEGVANDFWHLMVRQRRSAYWARKLFGLKIDWNAHQQHVTKSSWRDVADGGPVFCFTRFGRSVTVLPDGRIIHIGGEHEDWYDPDFCIYNDVIIETPTGEFDILVYSADVFPPTDFHTATLVDRHIYLIGNLGYIDQRSYGETPVRVLDTRNFRMKNVATSGEAPGWISRHEARFNPERDEIIVTGGTIMSGDKAQASNTRTFALDLSSNVWSAHD